MSKKLIVEVHHDSKIKRLSDAQNVPKGMMMVEGVFGRVDSMNQNNRSYSRENYSEHVSLMNDRISKENGILGEMEHPKSMNIDLNNVSHKIMDVRVDEDGFVRGRALLMDTPKGKIAQSIVRSGSALPISSRGMGSISENNQVKLDDLVTFDLVGTPGFSEAGLNKIYESKNDEGKLLFETYEYDVDDNGDVVEGSKLKSIVEDVEKRMNKNFDERVKKTINENYGDEPKNSVNEEMVKNIVQEQITNVYSPIFESWVVNDFGKKFGSVVEKWVMEDFALDNADTVQEWITNDFSENLGKVIENWIVGDFANMFGEVVENWVKEDFASENSKLTEEWLKEELIPQQAQSIQEWVTDDFAPNFGEILSEALENKEKEDNKKDEGGEEPKKNKPTKQKTNEGYEEQANIFSSKIMEGIDDSIEEADKEGEKEREKRKKEKENIDESFFKGNNPVWLQRIPQQYKSTWISMNESQKDNVYRKASVRNLYTEGDIKRFWDSINIDSILKRPNGQRKSRINEDLENNRFKRIGNFAKALKQ